jgi:phytoene dehydrogenase-like protein
MEYEAIVVGSGPNGLAAAITMQRQGLSVLLIEGKNTVGGGLRSGDLTFPGYVHDFCSAIHPMAAASPFFNNLPLQKFGLDFIFPEICAAHPLENGQAVALHRSLEDTVTNLRSDGSTYRSMIEPIMRAWPLIAADLLGPLRFPSHPGKYARFGLVGIQSAASIAKRFTTTEARTFWAGLSAHAMLPFSKVGSAAIGLVLAAVGHLHGWPIARGGSQSIADALACYFTSLGGTIKTGIFIKSLRELPDARAVILDVSPMQLLQIAGHKFSSLYKWQLKKFRYGMGAFKVDYVLDGPIPFSSALCRQAGTVHIGNSYDEIGQSEEAAWNKQSVEKPFVLVAQQSLFDSSRTSGNHQTAWAYCHVPNGSNQDMTAAIEGQIERYAPGFRDRIIRKHITTPIDFEAYNPNYVGGDINGGAMDISQLFTRPALSLSPYRTSAKGIYICSASTPPGGGVHGMCGYHAAQRALRDIFKSKVSSAPDSSKKEI